jgi:uncharacterized protein YndB with AHSA1/START domain
MTRLTKRVSISASPERVWSVLGDLAATPNWLPGTVTARVEGTNRVCVMADGTEVHEQIERYSPSDRTYWWQHVRVPLPVRDSHGSFKVARTDDGETTVVLEAHFEPLEQTHGSEVTTMIDSAYQESLDALRRFIEHGTRWNER